MPVYELIESSRRDPTRGFVISNSSPLFASTTFAVVRGQTGALVSVQSDQTDRTLETVQAIASFIPVLPFGLGAEQEEAELAIHLKAKGELLKALDQATAPTQVAILEEALAKVQSRIDGLSAVISAAGQKKKGVTASGSEAAMVEVVHDVREVDERLATIKTELLEEHIVDPHFLVILAPVDPE